MADVFISYKRENLQQVQRIVQGLRGAGLAVWWDQDIRPDDPWEQTIESELEKAKVVIVAWSQEAVGSENVKAEARRARNQGKLIQTFVESCVPPLFFGERQGVDLSTWNGDLNDHRFKAVLEAARAILAGKRPPQGVGYAPKKRAPWASLTAIFVFASAVFGFVSNLGGARDAVCGMSAVHDFCEQYGLVNETVDPAVVQAQARERLVQSLNGTWGRLDRDCVLSITFTVIRDENDPGNYRIRSTMDDGYDATMSVTGIDTEHGVISAREILPGDNGRRAEWTYQPGVDEITMRDENEVPTTLGRCG